jgi:hypothetical protein
MFLAVQQKEWTPCFSYSCWMQVEAAEKGRNRAGEEERAGEGEAEGAGAQGGPVLGRHHPQGQAPSGHATSHYENYFS